MKVILVFILSISYVFSGVERIESRSFIEISKEILKLSSTYDPQRILVIYDIDDTLLRHKKCIPPEKRSKSKFCNFLLYVKHCPSILTEPQTSKLVKLVQSKKFHTMSLTARGESLLPATFRELERHSISFDTKNFINKTGFRRPVKKKTQYMHKGVFFANGVHKGKTLKYLMKRFELDYNLIIFVDDNKKNIGGLANQLKNSNQNIKLYHYTKYDH